MSQLICDDDLFDVFLARGLLEELCEWWDANRLECHYVNDPVTVETTGDGRRVVHYSTPVGRTGRGRCTSVERRTAPLVVEPPGHWPSAGEVA